MNVDLPALTIAPDAHAIEAAARLSGMDPLTGPGRLVVTTPAGQITGILTPADLARAIHLRSLGMPVPTRAPEQDDAQHVEVARVPRPAPQIQAWSFSPTDPAGFRTPQRPIRPQPSWFSGF